MVIKETSSVIIDKGYPYRFQIDWLLVWEPCNFEGRWHPVKLSLTSVRYGDKPMFIKDLMAIEITLDDLESEIAKIAVKQVIKL